jgi:hypothetical protein
MELWRRFQEHPRSVGETYREHAVHATQFGFAMLLGALACLVHAAFPWLCTAAGSRTVARLHDRMVSNRSKNRLDEMRPLDPLDALAENI